MARCTAAAVAARLRGSLRSISRRRRCRGLQPPLVPVEAMERRILLDGLPAWVTGDATWSETSHRLDVSGTATIVADPGAAQPHVYVAGENADLTIAPVGDSDVHVASLHLTLGATATLASVGAGRSEANHRVLVIESDALIIDQASTLDLTDNDLIVDYDGNPDPHPAYLVKELVARGHNQGGWDGTGITSSSPAAYDRPMWLAAAHNEELAADLRGLNVAYGDGDAGTSLFAGQVVDSTVVLVKFTFIADINLDGSTDFEDLSVFNGEYDSGASTGNVYVEGDINYDGLLDFQDLSYFNGSYDPANVPAEAAPVLALDGPGTIEVDVGQPITVTGTYMDVNGQTVNLAVQDAVGNIGKLTGTSSGRWEWTRAAMSAPGTMTVTLTADDDANEQNGRTSRTLHVTIRPLAPANVMAVPVEDARVELNWDDQSATGVTYSVYGGTTPNFVPSSATLLASGLTASEYTADTLDADATYYFKVTATGAPNGSAGGTTSKASAANGGAPVETTSAVPFGPYGLAYGWAASPTPPPEYDFVGSYRGVQADWSGPQHLLRNESTTLTVSNLPPHARITMDFLASNSYDHNVEAPQFQVSGTGVNETYPAAGFGFTQALESFPIELDGSSATFTFTGSGCVGPETRWLLSYVRIWVDQVQIWGVGSLTEGDSPDEYFIERPTAADDPLIVAIDVSGTANPGVLDENGDPLGDADYGLVDADGNYLTRGVQTVTIPGGESRATLTVTPYDDGRGEPVERISVTVVPPTAGAGYYVPRPEAKRVNTTVRDGLDMRVDSNNDGVITDHDDEIEDDVFEIGKIIPVGATDADVDGVPDFADFNGIGGASFVPVTLHVSAAGAASDVEYTFDYDGVSAAALAGQQGGSGAYTPAGGLRLWKKDASASRSLSTDYIEPGVSFTAQELGIGSNGGTITLFAEAAPTMQPATQPTTKPMKVSATGPSTSSEDTVVTSPVKVTDVNVDVEDNVTWETPSIRANDAAALNHFVTVKGAGYAGYALLNATLSLDDPNVVNKITWEGAESPAWGNQLTAKVSTQTAGRKDVKIKLDGQVIWQGVVWVVWADLTIAGLHRHDFDPNTAGVQNQPVRIGTMRVGTMDVIDQATHAKITPEEMFDITKDIPDLRETLPNGDPSLTGNDPTGQPLSRGVNALWDMSRRVTIRGYVHASDGSNHGWKPLPSDPHTDYPQDPIVGNDDGSTAVGEDNNPYSAIHPGWMFQNDSPLRAYPGAMWSENGNIGDFYTSKLWFQDFARLRLGGKWVVISDPKPWRVEFSYQKRRWTELEAGDQNGNGVNPEEQIMEPNQDFNGDGDTNDEIGWWDDNPNFGSYGAEDNAGLP